MSLNFCIFCASVVNHTASGDHWMRGDDDIKMTDDVIGVKCARVTTIFRWRHLH
jgi:hypothetical protein